MVVPNNDEYYSVYIDCKATRDFTFSREVRRNKKVLVMRHLAFYQQSVRPMARAIIKVRSDKPRRPYLVLTQYIAREMYSGVDDSFLLYRHNFSSKEATVLKLGGKSAVVTTKYWSRSFQVGPRNMP